jgi:CDP-paratose 2-epimerase
MKPNNPQAKAPQNGRAHAQSRLNGEGRSNGQARSNGMGVVGDRLTQSAAASNRLGDDRYTLITGGAGFIGTNLASRLLGRGEEVAVLDNLSRPGVERNLSWLRKTYGRLVRVIEADVRDAEAVGEAVRDARKVFHFAAQVAVTTSLDDPRRDFETNALGTLNVLEACRACKSPPPLLFTSTNKVYGDLGGIELHCDGEQYGPVSAQIRERGISEAQRLDFHSPYGCSKGAADQYVLDYARCFGLPAVVFRMSCVYGPHQCGTEDQGWVAHFAKEAIAGRSITFYGDGRQVRDLLFVEDLIDAMEVALEHLDRSAGHAFNMGGGPRNAVSLREVVSILAEITGRHPPIRRDEWRQGDQKYYVSDTRAFERATGWKARVSAQEGIQRLCHWLNRHALRPAEPTVA